MQKRKYVGILTIVILFSGTLQNSTFSFAQISDPQPDNSAALPINATQSILDNSIILSMPDTEPQTVDPKLKFDQGFEKKINDLFSVNYLINIYFTFYG